MEREINQKLVEWKNSNHRKPLLIRGARQVGKSYSVLEFGKKHFSGTTHVFNFEKFPDLITIFDKNLDTNRIIRELELFSGIKIEAGNDLLFFDEIQEAPKAIMALRYFYEQVPLLHVIAAGSLLEFALQDISFPVGRIQIISMYPLTFAEYIKACNNEILAEKLNENEELPDVILDKLNNLLFQYFLIGGMPECVNTFIETNSYLDVFRIQTDLLTTFRQDFSKYAGHSDKRCMTKVLNSVSQKIGEQIKYAQLAEDFSNPTIKKAFELLETARLFTKVKHTNAQGIPLGNQSSEKKFKAVFLDIGLMAANNGINANKNLIKPDILAAFNGKLAEQFVGQELRAKFNGDIYYWTRETRGSNAELDYIVSVGNQIIPIEVKSGQSGRLTSLHLFMQMHPNIKTAIVLTENKYGGLKDQKIVFKPLAYAANIDKFI